MPQESIVNDAYNQANFHVGEIHMARMRHIVVGHMLRATIEANEKTSSLSFIYTIPTTRYKCSRNP